MCGGFLIDDETGKGQKCSRQRAYAEIDCECGQRHEMCAQCAESGNVCREAWTIMRRARFSGPSKACDGIVYPSAKKQARVAIARSGSGDEPWLFRSVNPVPNVLITKKCHVCSNRSGRNVFCPCSPVCSHFLCYPCALKRLAPKHSAPYIRKKPGHDVGFSNRRKKLRVFFSPGSEDAAVGELVDVCVIGNANAKYALGAGEVEWTDRLAFKARVHVTGKVKGTCFRCKTMQQIVNTSTPLLACSACLERQLCLNCYFYKSVCPECVKI